MEIIADLHTHTLVSNHAFNTLTEMARRAHELGLFAMAVTDHGPAMPDAPHPWYFFNLTTLPPRMEETWVLKGVEANVRSISGTLDMAPDALDRLSLDWVIASIHKDTLAQRLSRTDATELWLNVAQDKRVDMIGHSEDCLFEYDYERVAREFAREGKVVELNANSAVVRPGSKQNMVRLARACKANGTQVAVNTDAHSIYHLGRYGNLPEMLTELEFPEELVVNSGRERLLHTLREHHCPIIRYMEDAQ